MTNNLTHASAPLSPSEKIERIAQLALVGQAALNTNILEPHVVDAVASLFQVITEISDDLVQILEEQES